MASSLSGSGPMDVLVDADIASHSDAALVAREMVAKTTQGIPPSTLQDVLLVVSELVTNAVRHGPAGRPIHLGVQRDGVVRVEVQDQGVGFDPTVHSPGQPEDLPTGGFGLVIVERLAKDWGVAPPGEPTSVWAELHL